MSFAGRSDLISFLDQLVKVDGGPQVARGSGRPVLVLEGCGGSGRSELLRSVGQRWEARTPTVRVNSLALPDDQAGSTRPLLAAVMLGLSADVPGYKVSFDRVVLAYIAMSTPVQAPDPERAVEEMRQRLNAYRDRDAVIELVGDLVATSAAAVSNVPGAGAFGPVFKTAAQMIVKKLLGTRWLTRLTWKGALEWFGHRDQGLHHDPVRALVQLSVQTHSDNVAVRDGVDDLLVGALLADLRDSSTGSRTAPGTPSLSWTTAMHPWRRGLSPHWSGCDKISRLRAYHLTQWRSLPRAAAPLRPAWLGRFPRPCGGRSRGWLT